MHRLCEAGRQVLPLLCSWVLKVLMRIAIMSVLSHCFLPAIGYLPVSSQIIPPLTHWHNLRRRHKTLVAGNLLRTRTVWNFNLFLEGSDRLLTAILSARFGYDHTWSFSCLSSECPR
ncbi:hypothetical protein EDB19DRAFT_157797 [Suillus lakei]|nr:hypothetical protein EDB19DRAFT_157797 [Suillus lakei]